MDFTVWDVLLGTISWGIRLLFWPLGFVIKYREFFGAVLPYLALGVITLIVGAAALGLISSVLRGLFVTARGPCRFFVGIVDVLRTSRKERPQEAKGINAEPTKNQSDPYQIFGVGRDVKESELNARYRQLLRANHPDKVAQLDPEIQAFATERSRRIIDAYEQLRARIEA